MKFGKLPKKEDKRNLQLRKYLAATASALPIPQTILNSRVLPNDLGMMLNDRYGCCTISGAGHMIQSWTANAKRGMLTVNDLSIQSAYFAISPDDQGAYLLDALNHWRKKGVGVSVIEGFVEIDAKRLNDLKFAIWAFGSAYIGMSLPDKNTEGPWITVTGPPNPYNGHAVCLVDFDDVSQTFTAISWGRKMPLSYKWAAAYIDEAYAVLEDLSLYIDTGRTPYGFDMVQLQQDLQQFGTATPSNPPTPTPPPIPVPVPEPEPEAGGWTWKSWALIGLVAFAVFGTLWLSIARK